MPEEEEALHFILLVHILSTCSLIEQPQTRVTTRQHPYNNTPTLSHKLSPSI